MIAAALVEFAIGGLNGTSTEAIAARAGISQPYLFRLFPSKKELFLAVVERTFDRIVQTFERAAEDLEGPEALEAMGLSYAGLLEDRNLLLVQHHVYAASADPEVRTFVRRRYGSLWNWIADRTGVPAIELQEFFGDGDAVQRGRGARPRFARGALGEGAVRRDRARAGAARARRAGPVCATAGHTRRGLGRDRRRACPSRRRRRPRSGGLGVLYPTPRSLTHGGSRVQRS